MPRTPGISEVISLVVSRRLHDPVEEVEGNAPRSLVGAALQDLRACRGLGRPVGWMLVGPLPKHWIGSVLGWS